MERPKEQISMYYVWKTSRNSQQSWKERSATNTFAKCAVWLHVHLRMGLTQRRISLGIKSIQNRKKGHPNVVLSRSSNMTCFFCIWLKRKKSTNTLRWCSLTRTCPILLFLPVIYVQCPLQSRPPARYRLCKDFSQETQAIEVITACLLIDSFYRESVALDSTETSTQTYHQNNNPHHISCSVIRSYHHHQ